MRSTQQFSITLPNEMAEQVKAKVATGQYATESEVIREGLRTLLARDRVIEAWLHDEVTAAYDEAKNDPSSVITAAQVRTTLSALHSRSVKPQP